MAFPCGWTFTLGCALVLEMSTNNFLPEVLDMRSVARAKPSEERTQRKGIDIPHNRRQSLVEKKNLLRRKQEIVGFRRSEAPSLPLSMQL